jgi:hypothetical protein
MNINSLVQLDNLEPLHDGGLRQNSCSYNVVRRRHCCSRHIRSKSDQHPVRPILGSLRPIYLAAL